MSKCLVTKLKAKVIDENNTLSGIGEILLSTIKRDQENKNCFSIFSDSAFKAEFINPTEETFFIDDDGANLGTRIEKSAQDSSLIRYNAPTGSKIRLYPLYNVKTLILAEHTHSGLLSPVIFENPNFLSYCPKLEQLYVRGSEQKNIEFSLLEGKQLSMVYLDKASGDISQLSLTPGADIFLGDENVTGELSSLFNSWVGKYTGNWTQFLSTTSLTINGKPITVSPLTVTFTADRWTHNNV